MRRAGIAVAAVAVGLVGAGDVGAAGNLGPEVTSLKASPSTFCVKKSDRCRHPGTKIRFRITTDAKVNASMRPRSVDMAPYVIFVRNFKKGEHEVYLNDKRLRPDRWTLQLQGTNKVATGGIRKITVRVVKHR